MDGGTSAVAAGATRERLLRSGLQLARRGGLRALTVRGVAARARVNLGSFVYHFGSRDAFVGELIERWYAPLLAQLEVAAHEAVAPRERLRRLVLRVADWVVTNREFLSQLVMDASAGERAAQRFLRSLGERHPVLVLQAIRDAQRARELRAEEPLHVLLFVVSALGVPVLLAQGLGRRGMLPPEFARALQSFALERAQIERRLDWVLRGLAPGEET
jgi:AcrR family transcriptional regulator